MNLSSEMQQLDERLFGVSTVNYNREWKAEIAKNMQGNNALDTQKLL